MSQYSGINFLRERVRLQEATVIADRRIAFFTSIGLGICIAAIIAITGYRAFLGRQQEKIEEAALSEQQNLRTLTTVQSQLQERNEKIKTVENILEKRGKKWDAITYFYRELPADTAISSVNLSSLDGALHFIVSSPNVFSFTTLSTTLQSEEVKQSGYNLSMGSLSRGRTGVYELSVTLGLEDTEKATPKPAVQPK